MDKTENIEDFYKRKFNWIPEDINRDIGHFNVFKLEPVSGGRVKPVPYRRRDYFKITFIIGNSRIHYADKIIEINKPSLVFSNPYIPYAVSINGVSQNLYWNGGIQPTGYANKKDFVTFNMVYNAAGTWVIAAGLASYG